MAGEIQAANNDVYRVISFCIPRFHALALARMCCSSKSVAQLCKAHLSEGNQQEQQLRAAQLLQQAVQLAAGVGPHLRPLPTVTPTGPADLQDQHWLTIMGEKYWCGAITWLLCTVESTVLLRDLQLISNLIRVPGVPKEVVRTLVKAGLHLMSLISCDAVVAAARVGPLDDGLRTWLHECREAWRRQAHRHGLADFIWRIVMEDLPQSTVMYLLTWLHPRHTVAAAYIMINAPVDVQHSVWHALRAFQTLPAAQKLGQLDLIQLLDTVVARLMEAPDPTDFTCHASACFKGLFALPAVQELPCKVVVDILSKPIAAGKSAVVHLLCGTGPGAHRVQLPLHKMEPYDAARLLHVAVDEVLHCMQRVQEVLNLHGQVFNKLQQLPRVCSVSNDCTQGLIDFVVDCVADAGTPAGNDRSCAYDDTCFALDSLVGLVM